MTSTAKSVEIILQHIEQEPEKYNMKLNYDKCIHLRMSDIHTITYSNGQDMHRKTEATYLPRWKKSLTAATNKKLDTESRTHGSLSENLTYFGKRHPFHSNGNYEFSMQSSFQNYYMDLKQSRSRNRTANN